MRLRNRCVICGHSKLNNIYSFESFPVYMGVSDNISISDDVFEDMVWAVCEGCGCIQLKDLVDLSILYHKGHNSAYGKTWEKHHKLFASFVSRYCGDSVLEIGGGNLKLAELVTGNDSDLKFTVFDTNCEKSDSPNITTREEFFNYNNYNVEYDIDTVVHSHVLEHLHDPIEYMKTFARMLKDGQRMIMSVPLLDEMVKAKFTNSINFEHTYMIGESLLYFIINRTGFRIIETELFNPYNIFIVCEKTSNVDTIELRNLYRRNLMMFHSFVKFHEEFAERVNRMRGNDFYVFGGHIFTQYLFAFGLDPDKFVCVLDNDPNKIGRRLYGTNMIVRLPKILFDVEKPVVVLKAAQFSDEIKNDILININNETCFIE